MSQRASTRDGSASKSSIKVVLFAALGSLALVLVAILCWNGLNSWRTYRAALDTKDLDAGVNRFIAGLYEVLLERLETNNALQTPAPAPAAVIGKIEAFRKVVKENFDPGLAAIELRDFPNKQALLANLKSTLQKANDYRRQADEAIKLPRDRRDDNLVKTFTPVVTESINAALQVWFTVLHSSTTDDPQLIRLATIKDIGWEMRNYSGQERAIVASAIAAGQPIPAERLVTIAEHRARVKMLWDELQHLVADSGTHPAIKEAMRAAQDKYFKDFLSLSEAMRKAGEAGSKYPITAAQWVETTNPQIGALLEVMYAASRASESFTVAAIGRSLRDLAIAACFVLLVAAIALGCLWIVNSRVARPLNRLSNVVERLAANDTSVEIPVVRRQDEIGVMTTALSVFKDKMIEGERWRAEQKEAEARIMAERKADMLKLADSFEKAVGGIVETVSSAASQLEVAAGTLTKTAETTQQLSTTVAAASEEASVNVQSVASATNEMSSSVTEISRQVQESSKIASEAVKQGEKTNAQITELSHAANRIGDVVKLITSVAEQTNLLALNATIEAARAGEAGRGFAVVASEVKALASQTAKATEEISSQIAGMQTATQDSVAAIKEIGGTIGRISEISSTIAAAVEEQGAATQEIARNVEQAAQGTTQVASNITEVNRGAAETGSASSQVLSSAQSLSQESNRLKMEVDKFLTTVRAA